MPLRHRAVEEYYELYQLVGFSSVKGLEEIAELP